MTNQPLLLKPREAAQLWQLTNCREIAAVRIGRAVRYTHADLKAWIEARKSPPRRAG
jgi:predicted DNA-binding transcriptional regulator AlpA